MFKLPHNTEIQRVIPKVAFDQYTTSRQKKFFSEKIARITWLNKISPDTVNLKAKEIREIQIFKVELKSKQDIQPLLEIIDRSIPYHIIFIVQHEEMVYISTSSKHAHPVNSDHAVIDWTFKTSWINAQEFKYEIKLKRNLDAVYHDFCIQISGVSPLSRKSFQELIHYSKQKYSLEREINELKVSIKNSRQFKIKVELNLRLKKKEAELEELNIM